MAQYYVDIQFKVYSTKDLTLDEVVHAIKSTWSVYHDKQEGAVMKHIVPRKFDPETKQYLPKDNPNARVVATQISVETTSSDG